MGLAAAHERGVLHRDLKPANIMIDGRGQPRITDFGLAGLAAEIPLSDLRSGTPAYMSPEQKASKEVTVRSDLYALGLVLHEMFTGKARKDTPSSPTDLVKDLDPGIERLPAVPGGGAEAPALVGDDWRRDGRDRRDRGSRARLSAHRSEQGQGVAVRR